VDQGTINDLRRRLEEERDALRGQLEESGANPDHDAELDVTFDEGFADSAQTTAERARLISLIEGLRQNLADVEHALAKMDEGTYGTCERCGDPIAPERLEALPWARLCIDCKQKVG
jgi:RNA polymerase-binding protein DksA